MLQVSCHFWWISRFDLASLITSLAPSFCWCQNGNFSCRSWTFSARNTLGPETETAVGKMNDFWLCRVSPCSQVCAVYDNLCFRGCNNPRRHSEQLLWSCQSLIKLLVEIKIHVLSCSINFGLLGKWWVPTITAFEKYQSLCHHQDNNVRRMLFCFGVFPGCSLQSVCWVRTTRNLPLGYDTLDSPPQMEVEPSERRGLA